MNIVKSTLLISLMSLVFLSGKVIAQESAGDPLSEKAELLAAKMNELLSLSDVQLVEVYQKTYTYLQENQEIRIKYKGEASALENKLVDLHEGYSQSLLSIFSGEQKAEYQKMTQKRTESQKMEKEGKVN